MIWAHLCMREELFDSNGNKVAIWAYQSAYKADREVGFLPRVGETVEIVNHNGQVLFSGRVATIVHSLRPDGVYPNICIETRQFAGRPEDWDRHREELEEEGCYDFENMLASK